MNPNVLICQSERELEKQFSADFIAHIDGKNVSTLRQFYEEMADLFEIPDFGFTLDDLSDSLSDLHWLDENRIILYVTNTETFLSKERDPAKVTNLLNALDAIAEDWKWAEDEPDNTKEIIIVFEDSERIRRLLAQGEMNYTLVSALN